MKKVIFAAFAVLVLASCRKDYKCDCKAGDMTYTSTLEDTTLDEARNECNSEGSILGVDYECNVNVFK